MTSKRLSMFCWPAILVAVAVVVVFGAPVGVMAQAIKDLQTPGTPLVLKAQGSFFIGGEKSEQTRVELGGLGPGGTSPSIRCMYDTWFRREVTAMSP